MKRKHQELIERRCSICGHGMWSHGDWGECGDCVDEDGPCADGDPDE